MKFATVWKNHASPIGTARVVVLPDEHEAEHAQRERGDSDDPQTTREPRHRRAMMPARPRLRRGFDRA